MRTDQILSTTEAKIQWLLEHPQLLRRGVRVRAVIHEMKKDRLYSMATNTGDLQRGCAAHIREARARIKA